MLMLARRARGHFVTLIEIRVHLIRVKPIPLFTLVSQLSKSVEKKIGLLWFIEFLEQALHTPLRRCKMEF